MRKMPPGEDRRAGIVAGCVAGLIGGVQVQSAAADQDRIAKLAPILVRLRQSIPIRCAKHHIGQARCLGHIQYFGRRLGVRRSDRWQGRSDCKLC